MFTCNTEHIQIYIFSVFHYSLLVSLIIFNNSLTVWLEVAGQTLADGECGFLVLQDF